MRDNQGRYCSAQWPITADTHGKDREIQLALPEGAILARAGDTFEEAVSKKNIGTERPLNVMVFVHATPKETGSTGIRTNDSDTLISIVRSIAREPRITAYSVVAFNLERNRILYRGRSNSGIDYQALGNAMKRENPFVIDFRSLQNVNSDAKILNNLVSAEVDKNRPDAIIFVGQRTLQDRPASLLSAAQLGAPGCPVFYLNYDANPYLVPTRDPIGRMVKLWKGVEYTISKPRDFI
jgi:hypothetical protein